MIFILTIQAITALRKDDIMFNKLIDKVEIQDKMPYSKIDFNNEKFILRNYKFTVKEKGGTEWVITKDAILMNEIKIKGLFSKQTNIVTETYDMANVSELLLERFISGYGCKLLLYGETPKAWCRSILLGIGDIFSAHAAAAFIVQQKQGHKLKTKIDPIIIGMRQQLDAGELDKELLDKLRERGILDAIGWTGPTITPEPEAPPSSPTTTLSVADELSKLKVLLDDGILTHEEFEHKKKKLLGM